MAIFSTIKLYILAAAAVLSMAAGGAVHLEDMDVMCQAVEQHAGKALFHTGRILPRQGLMPYNRALQPVVHGFRKADDASTDKI